MSFLRKTSSKLILSKATFLLIGKPLFVTPMAHHHVIASPKSYGSLTSVTSQRYSTDSVLNPQPWYNDFISEDPPVDNYYGTDEQPRTRRKYQKTTYDSKTGTWKVECVEEEGIADKTSWELIQDMNDESNRNSEGRSSLTDSEISYTNGRRKSFYEKDTEGIQKLSVSDNQLGAIGRGFREMKSPKLDENISNALRLKEDLRYRFLKTTLKEFDDLRKWGSSKEKTKNRIDQLESTQQTTVDAKEIYIPDKDEEKDNCFPFFKTSKKSQNKPPGRVNIIENNIRIRRTKDKKSFRIKLVSPNTTIGGGIAMTNVNNPVTIGTRSSVAMTTKHSGSLDTDPVYDLTLWELCEEYDLTETALKGAISNKKGYLNLTRKDGDEI
ncbi:hypothetical protein WDU94_008618 [Cyamophila willieti]